MANKVEFKYSPMFQVGKDNTEYRLLTTEGVNTALFEGKEILKVSREALTLLAQQSFHDCEFMLRREHNKQVAAILTDPEASENDKYVALQFLRGMGEQQARFRLKNQRLVIRFLHAEKHIRLPIRRHRAQIIYQIKYIRPFSGKHGLMLQQMVRCPKRR